MGFGWSWIHAPLIPNHVEVASQQQIRDGEVAVHDAVRVQILQPLYNLRQQLSGWRNRKGRAGIREVRPTVPDCACPSPTLGLGEGATAGKAHVLLDAAQIGNLQHQVHVVVVLKVLVELRRGKGREAVIRQAVLANKDQRPHRKTARI